MLAFSNKETTKGWLVICEEIDKKIEKIRQEIASHEKAIKEGENAILIWQSFKGDPPKFVKDNIENILKENCN